MCPPGESIDAKRMNHGTCKQHCGKNFLGVRIHNASSVSSEEEKCIRDTRKSVNTNAIARRDRRSVGVTGTTNLSCRSSSQKSETHNLFSRRGLIPRSAGSMVTRNGKSVPEGSRLVASLGKLVRFQPCRTTKGMAEHLLQRRIFEPLPVKMNYDESLNTTVHMRRRHFLHVASHSGRPRS